jgi:hypothetical protein
VRGRIKRGTLQAQRTDEGVFVWLDVPDQTTTGPQPADDRLTNQSKLVEALLERVAYMREQLAQEREANRGPTPTRSRTVAHPTTARIHPKKARQSDEMPMRVDE